jgi:tetratricopeptide (TPR) repeat protein
VLISVLLRVYLNVRKKRRFVVVFAFACLVGAGQGRAWADETPPAPSASSTDLEEGKARFAAGRVHFDRGDFKAAMDEFQAGFALTRINGFLLNIGVCQRKLGQKQDALDTFEGLLQSEPNLPKRSQVENMIAELKKELGKDVVAAPAPAAADPEEAAPSPEEKKSVPAEVSALSVPVATESDDDDADVELITTKHSAKRRGSDSEHRRRAVPMLESSRLAAQSRPEPEDESILKSGWLWGGVGAVVIGVVAAVVLTSGQQTGAGSIGTVDLR